MNLTIQAFSIISRALTHTEGIIITIQNAFNWNNFATIFTSYIEIWNPEFNFCDRILPLLKNKEDLQALVEGVKIGLTKDQSQYRYQKRESHIVKFLQTTQRFIKNICEFLTPSWNAQRLSWFHKKLAIRIYLGICWIISTVSTNRKLYLMQLIIKILFIWRENCQAQIIKVDFCVDFSSVF